MIDYSEFSEGDFRKAFEYYYNALTSNKRPSDKPQACILGGQSGSGKSTIHKIVKEQNPNVIVIDGDRFREQHPNFEIIQKLYGNDAANYTQKFSNSIVNAMIEKLSSERYNLVIEGTCRTAEVPLKTCRDLKAKGYTVELAVMCTDKDISWQSTIDRYNEMQRRGLHPRAVPKEKYLETVAAISKNISVIYNSREFDEITLYNRERECLYKYSNKPDLNPATIVKKKLNEIELMQKALKENDEVLSANPQLRVAISEIESNLLKKSAGNLSETESVRFHYYVRNNAIKSNPSLKSEYTKARDEFRKASQSRISPDKPKNHKR
ncbi:MAG: zeta toxin family protein [Oscillospiraceae bacterium]